MDRSKLTRFSILVNHVVVFRDPYDKAYFLDKSIMAEFDCVGKGSVFDPNGVTQ
jgi:hypothetical protein